MILGKFLPPHLGHVYLADFARNYVDQLDIVVGSLPDEPIPGNVRFEWMRELFPFQSVHHLDEILPQDPSEHPQFWDLWRQALTNILPAKPDYVFASESYGSRLAQELGARFVPVDPARIAKSVSGTAIREDPFGNWDSIPNCVRPWFAKRVCVFGPESTGKSTLARQLADHFETVFVPEYARTHLESQDGDLSADDFALIAQGQIASEEALARHYNRVLFTDTDVLATVVWSEFLYGECPESILKAAETRPADLYLLTEPDIPWEQDRVRYLPDNRIDFFEKCQAALQLRNRNFVKISGEGDARLKAAVKAVEDTVAERSNASGTP